MTHALPSDQRARGGGFRLLSATKPAPETGRARKRKRRQKKQARRVNR